MMMCLALSQKNESGLEVGMVGPPGLTLTQCLPPWRPWPSKPRRQLGVVLDAAEIFLLKGVKDWQNSQQVDEPSFIDYRPVSNLPLYTQHSVRGKFFPLLCLLLDSYTI